MILLKKQYKVQMVFNIEKREIAANTLGIDSANKSDEELDKIRNLQR
jgi:hypothetical protein